MDTGTLLTVKLRKCTKDIELRLQIMQSIVMGIFHYTTLNPSPALHQSEMTTHFKKNGKKNGKKRDHASAGHSYIDKHRKHLRGRGNARGMHHYRILFDKYHPGYFGKVEMKRNKQDSL
ncbi:60S ribosomal protein L27a-3-like [Durio zibethinus]|uniref:60S ribosomal protein L27a-3-like n=1 Tax=Durio zibethinus TaxID=66656 RepID=A0A6P5YFG6_DURZI|nr:60S ribosomal protein L27a-3-like [Durio zibethinus]